MSIVLHYLYEISISFKKYSFLLSCLPNLLLTGIGSEGKAVYLKDIWPTRSEIQEVEKKYVLPSMFEEVYSKINVNYSKVV